MGLSNGVTAGRMPSASSSNLSGASYSRPAFRSSPSEDNRRYYFQEPPVPLGTASKFLCFVDFEPANNVWKPFPRTGIKSIAFTPQCAIAAKVNQEHLFQNAGWEEATLTILRDLCKPDAPFDSVYQFDLIKRTAELAAEGSLPLERTLQPLLVAINSDAIDSKVLWMDPDNNVAKAERRRGRAGSKVAGVACPCRSEGSTVPDAAQARSRPTAHPCG